MVSSPTFISTVTVSSAAEDMQLVERILRRQRAGVISAVATLAGLAWAWTLSGAGMSSAGSMEGMTLPPLLLLLAMWWVMMTAMMLPSAAPMILLYGKVRLQQGGRTAVIASWVFLSGYLLAWLGMSLLAALLQLAGTRTGLIDAMTMRSSSSFLAGATLIAVGVYQFSPVKNACLVSCRSPVAFLTRHWRPGLSGAARLGLLHGLYCVGCCWLLMALLFVGGVMNFLWIGALTLLVAAEKLLERGPMVAQLSGLCLIAWGAWELAS